MLQQLRQIMERSSLFQFFVEMLEHAESRLPRAGPARTKM